MQVPLSDPVLCQYNLSGDLAIADGDELRFAKFEVFSDPGYSFIRYRLSEDLSKIPSPGWETFTHTA